VFFHKNPFTEDLMGFTHSSSGKREIHSVRPSVMHKLKLCNLWGWESSPRML